MSKRTTKPVQKRGDTIKLVVKSNDLVEAKYMFNIWETRFFLTLVSLIDKEDSDEKVYRVWYKDIKKNFKLKSNKSYDFLREAAKSLNRKPVYIGWMKDQYRRGREYSLFEFVDYLESGQQGAGIGKQEYVDVKIQDTMRPFLLYVKKNFDPLITRYTSYDLRNTEKLQPYAIRIYELMKQFEYKGFRTIRIQDLKDMFLITNEYSRFSTFNQSVITPSIKAINKTTDLYIPLDKIEKIKEGRSVVALRFLIESKTREQIAKIRNEPLIPILLEAEKLDTVLEADLLKIEIPETETNTDKLFFEFEKIVIQDFGVTPSAFLKILDTDKHTKENIEQAIGVTRRAKYNQEIKKSVAGFFMKALQQGYTDEKAEQKKKASSKSNFKQDIENLEQEYADKKAARIKQLLETEKGIHEKTLLHIKASANKELATRLKELGLTFDSVNIEDFRKDKTLRIFFLTGIVHEYASFFVDLDTEYKQKLAFLKKKHK